MVPTGRAVCEILFWDLTGQMFIRNCELFITQL